MAKGFNPEQIRQIMELVRQVKGETDMPSPAPQVQENKVPLNFAPKVVAQQPTPTLTVVSPLPLVYPMSDIHGVSGEAFLELASRGKGEYTELSNPIFYAIRAAILQEQGGIDYKMLTAADRKALNTHVTALMTQRVQAIQKINREAAKRAESTKAQVATAGTPSTSATERVAASAVAAPPTPKLVLPPLPEVEDEQEDEPAPPPLKSNPNSLGPVGDKEVYNLVAYAKAQDKLGNGTYVETLTQWAKKESNQKRPGLARKIVNQAAEQLGLMVKG